MSDAPTLQAEFTLTRTFDAPRDVVWKAWTDAEALARWWGAKGSEIRVASLDLRPGGAFHYSMTRPDGPDVWAKFIYREVTPPERLVFVNSFADEHGNLAGNPWLPVWPLEILNELTFTEQDGKTTLDLRGGPINATDAEVEAYIQMRPSLQGGFKGTFQQLDEYLASLKQ
jgi:uncharacterized protein YndB with AHSA1/START domain